MDEEEAKQVIRKTLETTKTTLNEETPQDLRELLDAGFDSFQEYGEFMKAKMDSNQ
jgi:hypothetical protein